MNQVWWPRSKVALEAEGDPEGDVPGQVWSFLRGE